jgi:hypothetical protein
MPAPIITTSELIGTPLARASRSHPSPAVEVSANFIKVLLLLIVMTIDL